MVSAQAPWTRSARSAFGEMSTHHPQEVIAAAAPFETPLNKISHHFVEFWLIMDEATRVIGQLYDKIADCERRQ